MKVYVMQRMAFTFDFKWERSHMVEPKRTV